MQLIAYTLMVSATVGIVALLFATAMWIFSVVMYHRDAWYAARYGRPVGWPLTRWRKK